MKQSETFLQGEGDRFYERNKDKPRLPDPVLDAMTELKLQPKAVLELGCGNGWRLAEIKTRYNPSLCAGYDASEQAVKERVFGNVFQRTVVEALEKMRGHIYDTIIFGFCLYLVDREDLMLIAAHTDRVLQDGGHIIIHDFGQPISDGIFPFKTPYKHKEGVWSYHMNYRNLWTSNPTYKPVWALTVGPDDVAVDVLKKDFANAFPERKI